MTLANDINIDVEELMERISEGIPSEALRDQAHIQCFVNPMQILRAFSSVCLPEIKKEEAFSGKVSAEVNNGDCDV